uniref:Uncharacterized protein n=1 Tax=uncultured bacterium B19D1_C12D4_E9D6 TaxID=1329637 RepID=S4W409_9BACT|nr:hypothetical protein [uncultured bacterium B19D1_C12D4_E9D6]
MIKHHLAPYANESDSCKPVEPASYHRLFDRSCSGKYCQ